MNDKLHSTLGASSAHRWMACPGSVKLCLTAPPQKDSEYAAEGTFAHLYGEFLLRRESGSVFKEPVTKEMADAVNVYVAVVRKDQDEIKGKLEVEKRIDLSSLNRLMFGTNDALVYARWSKLIVYDYKHGKGIPVDVEDNVQLLFYALGAYIELQHMEFSEIEMVIVQPRADHPDGPVRRWTVPVSYITQFADQLKKAADATQREDAPLVPGSKQCRWCPAFPICPAAAKQASLIAAADFAEPVEKQLKKPEELTPEQLKMVLDNAGFLDSWLRAVEQYAEDQLKAGHAIPGYKLVKKRSTRKWISEEDVIKTLEPKFGKKIYSDPEVLSPAQMEKMIGKKEGGQTIVETLSETPDTGVVLAQESDKRPAMAAPALTDFQ